MSPPVSQQAPAQPRYRIGELAARAGVSVATIKFYIREGLLGPAPVKTGRTMGYYDEAYLERLRLIRTLREEHYLPLRVIREILADVGDGPLDPTDAALIARVGPGLLKRLDPDSAEVDRAALLATGVMHEDELDLMEEMGLVGEGPKSARRYSRADVELVHAFGRAQAAGLTRERFPIEGMGHYVELLGELARREVRRFTHKTVDIPPAELEAFAERALATTDPIVTLIRRKLILHHLRAELSKTKRDKERT